jgi:CheY-like chemotaxis protein
MDPIAAGTACTGPGWEPRESLGSYTELAGYDHITDQDGSARGLAARLSALLVDDEPIAREGLKLLLGRQPQVESASEARNGREAIALIREQRPDLVLLDVQIPRIDGFAVVHAVGAERMPPIIFVTAHDRYAIRAFEIAVIDYLLKPATEEPPAVRRPGWSISHIGVDQRNTLVCLFLRKGKHSLRGTFILIRKML